MNPRMARPKQPIEVVAHRGASWDRPENTLSAFAGAVQQGCDAIELDVQLSRDGVPVVYHDRTLVRAGGGRRRVAALDVRELRTLDAGYRLEDTRRRHRIPYLTEVLDRYADSVPLLIEVKLRDTPERLRTLATSVVDQLKGRRVARRPRLLCFDPNVLADVRPRSGDVEAILNVRAVDARVRGLRRWFDTVDGISVNVRGVTPRLGDAIAAANLPLLVFTCNTAHRVRRAVAAGAATIMSDRPGWLRQQLVNDGSSR